MLGNKDLPEFGCLRGLKVVHATQAVAGPFGALLLAEHGADVLWLENALAPDQARVSGRRIFDAERRNQRTMALNIPSEHGREIFTRIIREADVFIENGKGGQYEKWGLGDEALWRINPRLIIAHVSGFGEFGLQDYIERAAYDAIAQAFSGYTVLNSNGVTAPYPGPSTGDYVAGLFQAMGILAALQRVQKTGVGESIDVAMYECMLKIQNDIADFLTDRTPIVPAGVPHWVAGYSTMKCKDGEYLQLCLVSGGVLRRAIKFLGLDYGSEDFPEGIPILRLGTPGGNKLMDAASAYLATKTASEAEAEMLAAGLPVAKINSLADVEVDPHVLARKSLEEWQTLNGDRVKAVAPVPRFTNNPGRTWRAAPSFGMDNEAVLAELGFSEAEIAQFYASRAIAKAG